MSTVNYRALNTSRRSIKERFTRKRLGSTYALVAFGTVILCIGELDGVYEITGTVIIGLVIEFIAVSVTVTVIILMALAERTSARKIIRAFAADNDFTFTTPTPRDQSIIYRSYSFSDDVLAESNRIAGQLFWRLEGSYNKTPFAIERIETYSTIRTYRRLPHYITVLEIPVRHQSPKLACCSHDLAGGVTIFDSPNIIPSQAWLPFSFVKLADAFYSSYFIDEAEAEVPFDTESIGKFLFDLAKETSCDVEISDGKLFIFFNGGFPFTRESFERFFHIIEASRMV
jgi:hypothetical protein